MALRASWAARQKNAVWRAGCCTATADIHCHPRPGTCSSPSMIALQVETITGNSCGFFFISFMWGVGFHPPPPRGGVRPCCTNHWPPRSGPGAELFSCQAQLPSPLPLGRCCTFQERNFGCHFYDIHQMVPISRQISVKPKAFGAEKRLKRA